MTLPTLSTLVSFADEPSSASAVASTATVLHLEALADGRTAVLLDQTAAHPVDAAWPDQGADRGVLRFGATAAPLLDCVVAATDDTALYLGADIPVRKGTEGWVFVVAHVVASDAAATLSEGDTVTVEVDPEYRHSLSRGHTACHLASLALNRALSSRWSKEVRADALGSPDFDANAIDSSLIRENGSTDRYRLNKSLRRKGFVVDGLSDELEAVQLAVQDQLDGWLASDAAVAIERDGDALTDRRSWVCALPEATARIACGGTHLSALGELGALTVRLNAADEDGTLVLVMEIDAA